MTTFRLLGNGHKRRLGNGSPRAIGIQGDAFADIYGTTGFGLDSDGGASAWALAIGQTALRFELVGDADSSEFSGRTRLRIPISGSLTAKVDIAGSAILSFATAGNAVATVPLHGATAVSVEIMGQLVASRAMYGTANVRMTVGGSIKAFAAIHGDTQLRIGVIGALTAASARKWQKLWEDWYREAAEGWAAVDANNRYLAEEAGDAATAVANALVVTNTNVTNQGNQITALASRTTVLETRVTNVETVNTGQATAISGLQTTVTSQGNAITANSTAITNVSVRVTNVEGDVVDIANATELMQVDIDQVTNTANATWGVYLDVNGNVSGVQSVNDGLRSEFKIRADVFRLINSASSGLESQNGWLRAYNGASQVIIGNGFGTTSDLMFYAGPNVGVAAASKSNATIWFDQNGNAYFGGTLSAGIWKNAATSTQVGMAATVSTGNFESAGNTRTVVSSFSLSHTGSRVGNNAGVSAVGVTVNLYRNGSLIQSVPITGQYRGTYNSTTDRTNYVCEFGGSFTHTDNTGGTSCEYSLTLSSQVGTWPRTDFSITTGGPSQRLSVVSTEEP